MYFSCFTYCLFLLVFLLPYRIYGEIKLYIKQYIYRYPLHIWLIWSSGTLHAVLYSLPLPTFSLLLVVTSHLVLGVFTRQLLLSGTVSPLMSILTRLTTFCRHVKSQSFPFSLCHCLATHLSTSDLFSTIVLCKSIYLLTY